MHGTSPRDETLGLYVHLPFCRVHCTYCPFAVSTDLTLQDSYFEALASEIRSKAEVLRMPVETVYLGGGTPSRSSPDHLRQLRRVLEQSFELAPEHELTMEANPEDVTAENLALWSELGVNRLSLGVQSLHDGELLPLGRVHGAAGARTALRAIGDGPWRASADLILGLPSQTAASFARSLAGVIESGVGHVSLYMLDLEEGTALHRHVGSGRTRLPEDDLVADLYLQAIETMAASGLQQYEISNFARPGEESRHNIRYWTRAQYEGFGLGAHSFRGDQRYANSRDMDRYLETPGACEFRETLGPLERRRETLFLNLRQARGIQSDDVARLCGEEGNEWMSLGLREGWLQRLGSRVGFTPSGFLLSNEYMSRLF